MKITTERSSAGDFETLVELRLSAMRESLEAIGRFDRERSIERFRSSFSPENTRKIKREGVLIGFIAITEHKDHLYLDHLYIDPEFQSRGIGSQMMKELIGFSEQKKLPVRLGALKASNSNAFYRKHGFLVTTEDEWDIHYERNPLTSITVQTSNFSDYTTARPDFEEIRTRYDVFHQRLETASSADECLKIIADWDALLITIKEWSHLTEIRFHQDTRNKAYATAKEELDRILPKFLDLETAFKQTLLDSPFRDELAAATSTHLFALWECNTRSFSPAIEADVSAESKLSSEYTALTAGAEIHFRGEKLTLSELEKFTDDPDRNIREEACRVRSQWFADNAPEMDRIYDRMVGLRHGMAQKMGYDDFVEMGYQRMSRIGYGADDVSVFREEVQREVVPFVSELAKKQAQSLGLDTLMFWDNSVFSPNGNPAPLGDHDWMIERATEMFSAMGHGIPEFFEQMKSRGTMDLKSRKGKAGGGFCEYLPLFELPFIFANFNGTRADVDVFTHEMGHAFQVYSGRKQPMSDLAWPTTEACEIHSMALEFLTWPYMELFYGEKAAEELRRIHLTSHLMFLPYGVAVDHFQHLVYERPHASPEERNAMWQEMEKLYLPWYQYANLPSESSGRLWQAKRHIYCAPFYYIDYCLAQTGAMQFWSKSRTDREGTLKTYTDLCRLGGSRNYSDLLDFAGLHSPFQKGCLKDVMADATNFLNI